MESKPKLKPKTKTTGEAEAETGTGADADAGANAGAGAGDRASLAQAMSKAPANSTAATKVGQSTTNSPSSSKTKDEVAAKEITMETCVCGQIHQPSRAAYWIFCDSCRSWYYVKPKCVGFGEKTANKKDWACPSCKAA